VESDAPPDIDDKERGDVVLLADSSVEGEDIATNLRTRGFVVFDVPLGLLEARVASEAPRVVVLDVDQPGAIERAKRLREVPHGADVEILCVGDPLRAAELAISLFDNVFERPVDVLRLVERVMTLAIPAGPSFAARGTTPPPMYAQRPSVPPSPDSVPPISEIPRGGLDSTGLLDDSSEPAAALGLVTGLVRLSPELERRIRDAEERVRASVDAVASSEDDGEADAEVDPELLSMLDEPIDAIEDALGTGSSLDALGSSVGGTGSGSKLTPLPRPGTQSGTGTGTGTGVVTGAHVGPITQSLTQALTTAGDVLTSLPASSPPSEGMTSSTRAASPALGIRLGELFGIRPPERGGPTGAVVTPPRGNPRLPTPTQAQGFDPAVLRQLQQVVTDAIGAAGSAQPWSDADSPVSPPVRFQEPRDIATGRAVVDLHAGARSAPGVPPPSGRVSPAAQSVPSAKVAARDHAATSSTGPASVTALGPASVGTSRETSNTLPVVFREGEGLRPIARAIAARRSGSVALTTSAGVRRIILQDGDLVTVGSEIADENVVAFLVARGDLDRDAAAKLAGKLPPSGRHAGAALIAQGYLAQDDLWPVLRAHAEWLLGRAMTSGPGTIELEDEAPGRLKAEPGVFGGATGAEIYVEAARRVLSSELSLMGLGGLEARFDAGTRANLIGECALSPEEAAVVASAPGSLVRDLVPDAASELLGVLRALTELEVLSVVAPLRRDTSTRKDEPDPLDEEAVRKRISARLGLVREGDYFSLLGIGKDATAYEIKRAYLALRRAFEPTRLLTAATADLQDDVILIVEVLDEAYDILRDSHRRDRYRRAISAGPPG